MILRLKSIVFVISILLFFVSCELKSEQYENKKLVVCTTSIIGDVVKELVKDHLEVKVLMGGGVDPHLYEAKPSDVRAMSEANVIIYNGLHLEGKLARLFERMNGQKKMIRFSDGMPKSNLIQLNEHAYDPHVWFDVQLWLKGIQGCVNQLVKIYPSEAEFILSNFEHYKLDLITVEKELILKMKDIPSNQRVLITSHDAFHYFGKAYDVEVKAIQGVSTIMEPGLKEVSNLVNDIVKRNIKSIFVESSVSSKSIRAVIEGCKSKGHDVKIGGTLFSDALGGKGSDADTYIKMISKNAFVIHSALK
jgi:manganese/zinc/iron transport system substrate-binding protein